jgi:Flp pilus assembly protein TadG
MRSCGNTNLRDERGQTLVEFALVLPLLALVLFAVIQFGIVYNNYISLTDAVRAGARKGAVSRFVSDPNGTTRQAVVDSASGDLSTSSLGVTVTSDWQPGDTVTVQATYPYSINLFGIVVASGNLTSRTVERVE